MYENNGKLVSTNPKASPLFKRWVKTEKTATNKFSWKMKHAHGNV